MANSGPNTNGSQFFLVYKNSLSLPASYTPFGTIVSGLNIIQNVAKAGSDNSNGTGRRPPEGESRNRERDDQEDDDRAELRRQ